MCLIPQDIDYPALRLDVDREKASLVGLTQKEVVDNVITALTSNGMIAPNYWIDPKSGNPYLLTVQYPEDEVKSLNDLKLIPLRGRTVTQPTPLDTVVDISDDSDADRSRSLSTLPRPSTCTCRQRRKTWDVSAAKSIKDREHQAARRRARERARFGRRV